MLNKKYFIIFAIFMLNIVFVYKMMFIAANNREREIFRTQANYIRRLNQENLDYKGRPELSKEQMFFDLHMLDIKQTKVEAMLELMESVWVIP